MISKACKALLLLLVASMHPRLAAGEPAATDPRNFDASSLGSFVSVGPGWLFSIGDNPAWAAPAFDDSSWRILSTEKTLPDNGVRDIRYAWYRIHIHLRPGARNVAVALDDVNGSYEVFANGTRIGGRGPMKNVLRSGHGALVAYAVPGGIVTASGNLVLAIRCALNPGSGAGRGTSTPIFSQSVYLVDQASAPLLVSFAMAHDSGLQLLLCGFGLVVAMVSAALFLALRDQREYLAITVYLVAASSAMAALVWANLDSSLPPDVLLWSSLCVENFALIEFVRLVLHLPRSPWLLAIQSISSLAFYTQLFNSIGFGSAAIVLVGFYVPVLAVKILLPVLLIRGWARGNRDAGILLPAIVAGSLADYWRFVCEIILRAHFKPLYSLLVFSIPAGSYSLDFYRAGDILFYIAVLLFLVLRTVGIARGRARVAAELEAARTVQQVLIPEEIPSIPGFVLHSIYKPAGQVGGDFFQILPVKTGGVLVVIGDVSGKGMPAAMTVSLLVGTVRTLAHYTESPGQILTAMNTRMMARSGGGFTTCLVLRADTDGTLTVANAGHLYPYLDGRELPIENGLPLGLASETAYPESVFQLAQGEQLTLLSDGVVEARDKTGKLFGFDRAAAITSQSAEQIAQAAEQFGQEDDITALTLARTG